MERQESDPLEIEDDWEVDMTSLSDEEKKHRLDEIEVVEEKIQKRKKENDDIEEELKRALNEIRKIKESLMRSWREKKLMFEDGYVFLQYDSSIFVLEKRLGQGEKMIVPQVLTNS